jgi:uncharacterized protein YaaR (DUF327 family)
MKYTREQAEEAKQIVKDFMKHHDICMNSYKWNDFLNAKFPTIEVGKWYKSEREKNFLGLITEIDGIFRYNGFNVCGDWKINDWYKIKHLNPLTPATEQEVLDRLTKEAKKIYKVGDRVRSMKSSTELCVFSNDVVELEDNYFLVSGISVLNLSTGEWAEVVESNPIHDKIEALERELAELKELIKSNNNASTRSN